MKKITYLLMLITAMFITSCSDDDNTANLGEEVAGTYTGTTNVSCAYFSDNITENETLTITAIDANHVAITYVSESWGTFTFNEVVVTEEGSSYKLAGEGTVLMGMNGNVKEYDCSISGTITKGVGQFTITCPTVMQGTTIQFN